MLHYLKIVDIYNFLIYSQSIISIIIYFYMILYHWSIYRNSFELEIGLSIVTSIISFSTMSITLPDSYRKNHSKVLVLLFYKYDLIQYLTFFIVHIRIDILEIRLS